MTYPTLFEILGVLDTQSIHYRVDAFNPDVVTITASVPGQLWEIQCFENDPPEMEVFVSDQPMIRIDSVEQLRSLSDQWAEKDGSK